MSSGKPTELDLFVIGGGSGGVRAARIAAQHGAKVAIAEHSRWGGTCVVRGCVPKKLLVYGSAVRAQIEDARAFGWTFEGARVDWPTLRDAVQREVTRLSGVYAANLDKRSVERIDARARVVEPGLVEVGGKRVRAKHVLVATGGAPRRPHIPGCEKMLTSDDVFTLERLPETLLVVGAGYIGLEMAHIFAGLGVRVILAHHGPLPLRGFDLDVRTLAAASLTSRGIEVHANCQPTAIEEVGGRLRVHLSACEPVEVDAALAATGRLPQSHGIGLEELGVAMDAHGGITVDEYARTNVPGLYAVGDVTGRLALTPIAIREGQAFADTVFGNRPTPFVPDLVATAVFAQPAIATIGLSEEAAHERGLAITVHKSEFRPLKHTVSGRQERVLIKVVCDAATRRVLGLHLVGDDAPEIIQAAAIAITMGCTKDDLDRTVAVHPTAAEELVLLG